jgi:hypothetical protein
MGRLAQAARADTLIGQGGTWARRGDGAWRSRHVLRRQPGTGDDDHAQGAAGLSPAGAITRRRKRPASPIWAVGDRLLAPLGRVCRWLDARWSPRPANSGRLQRSQVRPSRQPSGLAREYSHFYHPSACVREAGFTAITEACGHRSANLPGESRVAGHADERCLQCYPLPWPQPQR